MAEASHGDEQENTNGETESWVATRAARQQAPKRRRPRAPGPGGSALLKVLVSLAGQQERILSRFLRRGPGCRVQGRPLRRHRLGKPRLSAGPTCLPETVPCDRCRAEGGPRAGPVSEGASQGTGACWFSEDRLRGGCAPRTRSTLSHGSRAAASEAAHLFSHKDKIHSSPFLPLLPQRSPFRGESCGLCL